MHIIPLTATAARTLQPTTAATRQLQSWTVSSLERPHAESSSPAMRLVGQGGRQHHCKVTNYEFERVAHTELHTPGLLVDAVQVVAQVGARRARQPQQSRRDNVNEMAHPLQR